MSASTATTLAANMQNNTTISSDQDPDLWVSKTPRMVFLTVFIGMGFVGNLFFLLTISQSRRLRSMAFFIFLSNLAAVNICECALNMSLLLATSIIDEWKFGEIACRMSSFFICIISKETFLALTITTADRFVASRFGDKYNKVVSRPRIAILISFTWVQSFSLSVPIAVGTVPSSVNKYIVYCTLSKGSSIVYAVFSVLLCFIVPIILVIIFFVKIIRAGCKSRYINRNLTTQHDNFSEDSSETSQYKHEIQHLKLTGTLFAFWLILEGPYVVTSYYAQFRQSSALSNDSTQEEFYVWYVDLVLLYLRFSYTMALPFVAFTWNKELWKCCKDFVLCRKNNSVVDESFKKTESDTLRLERKLKEERMKEKVSIMHPREQRVFQVPVLFATSHGVHIKTSTQNESSENDTDDASHKTGTLTGRKCDVVGSRDNLNAADDDTSDYDSGNELDPFSVSHPICVRQFENKTDLREDKRSMSEPEVRTKKVKTAENSEVPVASNGDSGVDLSNFHTVAACKSTFHSPNQNLILQNSMTLHTEILEEANLKTLQRKPISIISKYSNLSSAKSECSNDFVSCDNDLDPEVNGQTSDSCSVNSLIVKSKSDNVANCSLQTRKKKRRKQKLLDTVSLTPSVSDSGIPPLPPPRLAPIVSNGGHKCLISGRPDSKCPSPIVPEDNVKTDALKQFESADNVIKPVSTSKNILPVTSFNSSHGHESETHQNRNPSSETTSKCLLNDGKALQLDCKQETEVVSEDVITPSDCHIQPSFSNNRNTQDNSSHHSKPKVGAFNEAFEETSEGERVAADDTSQTVTVLRNTEARRKRRERREKFTSSGILTDGYKRLVQETP